MRTTKISRFVTAAVLTTVASATVVTFARADDSPPTTSASGVPDTAGDVSPRVEQGTTPSSTPDAPKDDPTPEPPTTDTTSGDTSESATATSGQVGKPSRGSAPRPRPSEEPSPSPRPSPEPRPTPSPTPTEKNLIEILLGL